MFPSFFRLLSGLMSLLVMGCVMVSPNFSTVDYYDYGAGQPEPRLLDAYPVHLLVKDLRPEVLSSKKTPLYVGTAEDGFGEPKDVLNSDDCPVPNRVHGTPHCRSFAETILHRLQSEATGSASNDPKGLVLIEIWQWESHAGTELRLDYALEVYIRSPSGERLAQASIQGQKELIDTQAVGPMTFANHSAKAHQLSLILARNLDEKLRLLLSNSLKNSEAKLR